MQDSRRFDRLGPKAKEECVPVQHPTLSLIFLGITSAGLEERWVITGVEIDRFAFRKTEE